MSRKGRIFMCAGVLAAALAGTFLIPAAAEEERVELTVQPSSEEERSESSVQPSEEERVEPTVQPSEEERSESSVQPLEAEYTVAWWSMMYEMPNPEQLPVRVRFQWLKGLE